MNSGTGSPFVTERRVDSDRWVVEVGIGARFSIGGCLIVVVWMGFPEFFLGEVWVGPERLVAF